jgi:Domain of unknown function (DUF4157)
MGTFAGKAHATDKGAASLAPASTLLLRRHGEESRADAIATEALLFQHDFGRISICPRTTAAIQRKLTINTPGDEYEREADRVASQVTQMPPPHLQRMCDCGGTCSECQKSQSEREHALHLKRVDVSTLGPTQAPPEVDQVLRAPGQQLDPVLREFMESRFGYDFSNVRVHTGSAAAASALSLDARAMTVGTDIVFADGEYAPGTRKGQTLLAHELTHVVQQGFGRQRGALQRDSPKRPAPPAKSADQPDPLEVALKEIENNWKGLVTVATPFTELKQWVAGGNAVVALIQTHTNGALAAIGAKDHDLARAYTVALESDKIMYDFIAWHVVPYANLLSLRSGIDGLINAFEHDSDVGFGLHYFRAFKGRAEAERIARSLKKAINDVPTDSKTMLGWIRTDVQLIGGPTPKNAPIIVTSAANPKVRASFLDRTAAMKSLQVNIQRGVDFENQFLDGAFKEGGQQALDNVAEYYKLKSALGKGDKKSEKKESPQPQPVPVPLTPIEEDEEKKKKRAMMRHQIQQGLNKHYASFAVMAVDDNGVTGRQLRDAMASNFKQYMEIAKGTRALPKGWTKGPVDWEKPIRAAIISQSQAIPAIVAAGGVTLGGDINAMRRCFDPRTGSETNCGSDDVRLDVENRGHNLRREE